MLVAVWLLCNVLAKLPYRYSREGLFEKPVLLWRWRERMRASIRDQLQETHVLVLTTGDELSLQSNGCVVPCFFRSLQRRNQAGSVLG
jgi:hypothetical protein